MWKKFARTAVNGMFTGIALNYILAMILSYQLKLGYLMLYPASLPEYVGGEMAANLCMLLACGALGAGVGLSIALMRTRALKPRRRHAAATVSVLLSVLPAVALALQVIA